jgi:hypothetical protein
MPRRVVTYSDDQIAKAKEFRKQDLSWREIGTRLGVDPKKFKDAFLGRVKREAQPPPESLAEEAARLVHLDPKKPPPKWDRCLDGMRQVQKLREEFSTSLRRCSCVIETTRPVAVTALSDLHIGSPATDYDALHEDLDRILGDPRFFVLKGGDWADKFIPSFKDASAPAGQLQPPAIQLVTIDQIMNALNGRIIAAIGGNHDRMDEKKTGISTEYFIHRDKPFPYLPTGGLLELTVGQIKYKILWTHQYGTGNSRLNKHNVFRWLRQELSADCDIYIIEHHHDPSIMTHELEEFAGRRVVEVRTGSYKIDDRYSQQFFKEGRPGPQTLVLWPDRKKIAPMHGADAIEDAKYYLDGAYGKTRGGKAKG